MKVCEIVELAKRNNRKAKVWLINHYKPIIRENVKNKYGDAASKKILELLPNLIDYYLEHDIKDNLSSFLNWKADSLFRPKNPKNTIGDTYPFDDEKFKFVANYYANKFYEKIEGFNEYLSPEELKEYSYAITKSICLKHKDCKSDFRHVIWQDLIREAKYYEIDIENLLQKYIIYVGLTDKVFEYFCNKYLYIMNCHKRMGQNNFAKQNYNIIIKGTLTKLKKPTKSLESLILLEMNALYEKEIANVKRVVSSFKDGNQCDALCVYEFYAYIKQLIFNNFQGQVIFNDEKLKEQIEIKYNDYVNAYLNGTANANMPRYINTRLTTYFNRYLKNNYKDADKIKINKKQDYRKNIITIKETEELEIKVLRHPVIK